MQKPRALKPGCTVAVVAPASDVDRDALARGVVELQNLGFRAVVPASTYDRHVYFAGTHEQRAQTLTEMFVDPQIDAIFCARGGYGCHHLVKRLDADAIRRAPKVFMGYSDITVLLQFLENQCGMVCFHGPMATREFGLGEPAYHRQNLLECLTQTIPGQRISSLHIETLRGGVSHGILTGGCLSLLTATLGTPYELEASGKILFLEDVNAKPYQVDRMLMHLKLAGKLEGVQGIIFGEMLNCVQTDKDEYRLQDIVMEILQEYSFPVLYGLPSGHTSGNALTLPFGVRVLLNADESLVELEEAAVQC